jgi:hypothetical protein
MNERNTPAKRRVRRPQPALIVAVVALIAATAGSATALPGRNVVDRNDVKKNAITSKAIKNGQVTDADIAHGAVTGDEIADGTVGGADLADGGVGRADLATGAVGGAAIADGGVGRADIAPGAVTGAAIADGTVGRSDIAPIERFHVIGAPGEPKFSNGGEGDCVWKNGLEYAPGTAPAGFAKDALGRVWLRGIVTATDGTGGDAKCDPGEAGEAEDGLVFILPPDYRPAYFDVSGLAHGIVIAPDAGAKLNGTTIPPGGVYSVLRGNGVLDGVSIRAATGKTLSASEPAQVSLRDLSRLAG